MRFIGALLILAFSSVLTAQQSKRPVLELPECDIFLFDLTQLDGKFQLENSRNVTARKGYDNQPWFTPDSQAILFTANHQPDRTDVFEYRIETKELIQITDSIDQEYSPQISPDNKTLSFVNDGATANQSVWRQQRNGEELSWLLKNMGEREPVGYYSWNHETGDILFWSRYGFSIRLTHEQKNVSRYISGDAIPSTPHIIPKTNLFSFVHRQGNGEVWIKELNPKDLSVRPLTIIDGTNYNYGWSPDGSIFHCHENTLRCWSEETKSWQDICDLSGFGLKSSTRVAISPDGKKLAIVGQPSEQVASAKD